MMHALTPLIAGLAALACATTAHAQDFPKRPITMMVGLAAGGLTDTTARIYADAVTTTAGWKFAVENRAGSGGGVAAAAVQTATPDGHTILVFSGSQHATVAAASPGLYQPVAGFAPVTLLFDSVVAFMVPGSHPAKSLEDLFEIGKKRSGGLTFATQGVGSPTHLLGAKVTLAAKVPVEYAHYRGSAAAMTDILAGRVDFALLSLTNTQQYLAEGQLRALAVDSPQRLPKLPNVPTLTELGFGNEKVASWFALATTAGTPKETVEALNRAFITASKDPTLVKRLTDLGTPILTSTPDEMGRRMVSESAAMESLVRTLGLKSQ